MIVTEQTFTDYLEYIDKQGYDFIYCTAGNYFSSLQIIDNDRYLLASDHHNDVTYRVKLTLWNYSVDYEP